MISGPLRQWTGRERGDVLGRFSPWRHEQNASCQPEGERKETEIARRNMG